MKLKSIHILYTFVAILLFSCKDTEPKTYTYVLQGKISIENKCGQDFLDTLSNKVDTLSNSFEINVDVVKGSTKLGKQRKVFRLNDSFKGQYSFSFTSKIQLDSTWHYTIPRVKIKCPYIMCSRFDSIENCAPRSQLKSQRITPLTNDTMSIDLPWECYCK